MATQHVQSGDAAKSSSKTETVTLDLETKAAEQTTPVNEQLYLLGLRGLLVVQGFIWVFLQTFVPAVVSADTKGPFYQRILRDVFSTALWNGSFIQNFFILLSMRTIAISFLTNPNGQTYAATVIRRIIRMVLLLCTASGIATLVFSQIGTQYIDTFKSKLPNDSIRTPIKVHNALAAFGSLFNLFWLTGGFYTQAANSFWPTGTLWVPSVVYYQSFTVYFIMAILPYTRPAWHLQGLALFAIGSFWMESWGWYSATGLFFADLAVNPTLNSSLMRGLPVRGDLHVPYWILAMALMISGVALKYVFTVLPQYSNAELVLHPYLDLSENHSRASVAANVSYARVDDWLIVVGILIMVERFQTLKRFLSLKPFVLVGKRSFSIFAAQCIVCWTIGIKLWLALTQRGSVGTAGANAVTFVVSLCATAVFAELFYRAVDCPSIWLARNTYRWLVT